MASLLLEIGSEEIPAGYIEPALQAMVNTLQHKFKNARIDHGAFHTYATPRRLAVKVDDVAAKQISVTTELTGPPKQVAFAADGKPTVAAHKFAEKAGVKVSALKTRQTPKGEYLCARVTERGLATSTLLKTILPEVVKSVPFPKTMRWGTLKVNYARPIHSIVALLGSKLISFNYGNIKSGRYCFGHSFMQPGRIKLSEPGEYVQKLKDARVIVDIGERKQHIAADVAKTAAALGGQVLPDEDLLAINTNLVEYPIVAAGRFEDKYLEVPDEVLITAMREHQKYFAVTAENGNLLPHFICVNNTITKDVDVVTTGHERVLRARLEDARFFYHTDLKIDPADWVERLEGVLFQAKLGSMRAKVKRVKTLAEYLAGVVDADPAHQGKHPNLKQNAGRAAWLCKADLVSQMVGEFPKLQGIMGRVYAAKAGEAAEVATAIEEHYRPTASGGRLPQTITGALVSIADKIDSICGCFSVGLIPTGASDPYALRRQGIGIIQIMRDQNLSFSLAKLIAVGLQGFEGRHEKPAAELAEQILAFLTNRITHILSEEGFAKDIIAAVVDVSADQLPDVVRRVQALQQMKAQPDFEPLAIAFKRAVNILKKADYDPCADMGLSVNVDLFEDQSEIDLHAACKGVKAKVDALLNQGDYAGALLEIATLRGVVDAFFDGVLVMADDRKIRANRFALLGEIAALFVNFADFSKLST